MPLTALWILLAGILLFVAPSQIWHGAPVWRGGTGDLLQAVSLAVGFVLGAIVLHLMELRRPRRLPTIVASMSTPLAAVYLLVLVLSPTYSRGVLLVGFFLFGLLVVVRWLLSRHQRPATAAVAAFLALALVVGIASESPSSPPAETDRTPTQVDTLVTHLQVLERTRLPTLGDTIRGGGLAPLGEDMLVVTGGGTFWRLELSGDELAVEPLDLRAPLNREDFILATDTTVKRERFRVAGLLVQPENDSVRVVVVHHYWNVAERCFVLRVSEARLAAARLRGRRMDANGGSAPEWQALYDTAPCLGLASTGDPFAGQQAGGRIAALGDGTLILTVGDHQFDGVTSGRTLPQVPDTDYGKTLIVRRDGTARVFTMGHRNPEGLLVTSTGDIWGAEHGPRGGDELNLLIDGANYGWPFRTYGTRYEELTWPLADESDAGEEFTDPRYVWVPSIGVSNLIEIRKDAIPAWKGDLVVASLGAQSLYRLHREQGRFVYSERIETGGRVRDLAEAADGRLVLWSDDSELSILRPIEPPQSGG